MIDQLIGKRISIPNQFTGVVTVQAAEEFAGAVLLTVQTQQGDLREAMISPDEAQELLTRTGDLATKPVDAQQFFLFIESSRIKLAFAYDPHFAVSLSGVRPLPHQLEAVYSRILPQARIRFLLADDPGAGKTIMAGLLIKELKLRGVIERVLILSPAPLTLQWQDELRSKFSETFEVINSTLAKGQLAGNPWERFRQCIASIDFAKREDVIPGIFQVDWDLVIIDEAHKCSARTQGEDLRRTGRYKLAEELSRIAERILLLTATPHQGDVDQFHNFLRLLDPDQFIASELNPEILKMDDSPWFLRRIKEELRDFEGQRLFKPRHARTVSFELSGPEKVLYDKVTKYINRYLGKTTGRKQASVALARTVLQRRLASSLNAIYSSLKKRQQRFTTLLEELDGLSSDEQRQRLMAMGKPVDSEMDSDDCEEDELDELAIESTVAEQIDQLREELDALRILVNLAKQTIELGTEAKLSELKRCLTRGEFDELQGSDGKLLIFTEHRDTLDYLKSNLEAWGYSTCEIHGGMNPLARKVAQKEFQLHKQVCLATEAAGEGINLQFCRLMINYDIPWNPNRLEQRMGRIKRFGQTRPTVDMLNLVYQDSVDETIYERLSERMRDRFDLFGSLPDTIEDTWIENIETLDEKLDEYIHAQKRVNGFDIRYNASLDAEEDEWRNCARVLSRRSIDNLMRNGW